MDSEDEDIVITVSILHHILKIKQRKQNRSCRATPYLLGRNLKGRFATDVRQNKLNYCRSGIQKLN